MSTIATRIAAASVASSVALLGLGAASGQAAAFDGKSLKAGSVTAGKLRKDTLTGIQIRESTLGLVPIANLANLAKAAETAKLAQEAAHAAEADHAKSADTAKSADKAKEADHATTADTAKDSDKLDGRDSTEFLSNKTRVVMTFAANIADGAGASHSVSCDASEKGIGGGGGWYIPGTESPTSLDAQLASSSPLVSAGGDVTGWRVSGRNQTGSPRDLRTYVICVPKSA